MSKLPIPDAALDDRLGFVGTAGSGKTYSAKGCVERLLAKRHRVVIVDPLDVWYGLRLKLDGKTPAFPVAILGGKHGDLPLNEHSGALIGEAVARSSESCIISLTGLRTSAARERFMLAFLDMIYERTDPDARDPYHVVFDEADLWAPQKPMGNQAMLCHLMEEIVRRGRVKGFIPWVITQRPAVINKNVLSQVDGLVAMKLTSSQDRDALGAWIEGQADRQQGKEMLASLPTLERGSGIVWLPARGILGTRAFPENQTFDSSRTPKRGEKKHKTELKPLDVGALREKLAAVEAEVAANDPKKLKDEIAKLKAELTKATQNITKNITPAELKTARDEGFAAGEAHGGQRGYEQGFKTAHGALASWFTRGFEDAFEVLGIAIGKINKADAIIRGLKQWKEIGATEPTMQEQYKPDGKSVPQKPYVAKFIDPETANKIWPLAKAPRDSNGGSSAGALPQGERAILIAVAQYPDGAAREQLSVLTGYKRSSRDAYLNRLRNAGLIEVNGPLITATESGVAALGYDYEPLPTGADLRAYWLGRLPEGEKRILSILIDCYPNAAIRTDLDQVTGYKRSSRDAYLNRLSLKRLVTAESGGIVKAADLLFTEA